MKTCFKCKRVKPLNEFYKHSGMTDGHLGKCKACTKDDAKTRYWVKRDIITQYERKRSRDPARKIKALGYQRKSNSLNPDKYRARTAVNNALRDKRLQRQPCKVCNDTRSQAHHCDYSKPLEVDWLCFKHHRENEHSQIVT